MNNTPRTDEAQFGTGRVSVDFARRLERELTAVTEQRDRLAEACKLLMAIVGKPNSSVDSCWASEDEMDAAWNMGNEALQSLNQTTP